MRKHMIIALAVTITIMNIFGFNHWIARYSIHIATFTTAYPFPFHIEASYSEGYFQNVELGGKYTKILAKLAERNHCTQAVSGKFVDAKDFQISNTEDTELVLLCRSGGIAWNEIFLIQKGVIKEIRISGGLWL